LVFLLFFLGLEFSLDRLRRTGRHVGLGGSVDLVVNGAIGLLVGIVAFGFSFGALVLAAAIYVSSSAITVKGLRDFRQGVRVHRRFACGLTLAGTTARPAARSLAARVLHALHVRAPHRHGGA